MRMFKVERLKKSMNRLTVLIFTFGFLGCASIKDQSFKKILENAQHDIEVDSVKYFTTGLPFVKPILAKEVRDTMSEKTLKHFDTVEKRLDKAQMNQKLRKKIMNQYGLYELNLGCMIDKQTSLLSKEYKKATNPYLEKRNGKGWRERMEKELDSIAEN
ncbi:hypothetical protein AAFH68_50670 [Flavobacterium sp. CGRL1]